MIFCLFLLYLVVIGDVVSHQVAKGAAVTLTDENNVDEEIAVKKKGGTMIAIDNAVMEDAEMIEIGGGAMIEMIVEGENEIITEKC